MGGHSPPRTYDVAGPRILARLRPKHARYVPLWRAGRVAASTAPPPQNPRRRGKNMPRSPCRRVRVTHPPHSHHPRPQERPSAAFCVRCVLPSAENTRVLAPFEASKSPPQTRASRAPGGISRVHPRSKTTLDGSPPRAAACRAVAGRQRCWSGEKKVGSRQMARAHRTTASLAGHVWCCGSG
jgi:hypothetical protein